MNNIETNPRQAKRGHTNPTRKRGSSDYTHPTSRSFTQSVNLPAQNASDSQPARGAEFTRFRQPCKAIIQTLTAIALFTCLTLTPAQAQDKPTYTAVGAPSQPKVDVHWNRYHDHAQSTKLLQDLAKAHPDYCKLESLGKSYGKRDMWVMTITAPSDQPVTNKPGFWIDGGIHANEVQSVEVVLYTAWFLLEARAKNKTIQRLLDERVFYLMPMMSPDSRDAHFYEANNTHTPRTGQRPVDDDRDGLVDEDGPDDLDKDGHITQMRVRDKNGPYKTDPKFPNVLVHKKPGEQGEYRLLGSEGFDNDRDGKVNEDGDGNYDPNRDWAWNWQPKYIQRGAHRYPFSIKENRLVANFIKVHPNIAGAQTYHNAGGMLLRGPGVKSDKYEGADERIYQTLVTQGEQILPGYRSINVANELYEVFGGEFDWLFSMQGIFTFNNELFTSFNYFRKAVEGGGFFGTVEERNLFNKYLLFEDGTAEWTEVDHPQYGKVEVGGLKKSWVRQPPSFLLEEECHRNMAFTLYHADEMPLVKVQSVEVKQISDNLRQVTAIIENTKIIPTHAAIDVKRKITPADIVSIEGKDLKIVLGMTAGEPFFKSPSIQKQSPAKMKVDTIAGQSVIYVRWLLQGNGPYTVAVHSIKGGHNTKTTPTEK